MGVKSRNLIIWMCYMILSNTCIAWIEISSKIIEFQDVYLSPVKYLFLGFLSTEYIPVQHLHQLIKTGLQKII